ncbi:NADPH-dependent FMN reductase [Antrihabitans cavernicola]|uniref:NAD(P)H-dependent oxidoreductase n=1 Tax=Antrihabitans cavernicola TaxID=2495913 RepID=A0A5A7SH40_9NOCA|nr:NAD(P)H-dependent oxidoreductase [Spelaeibacter cavernicola]KAA0024944.1 NAD(P)H-dependent oxidoreductase [Spelaeibacter cavernicola]
MSIDAKLRVAVIIGSTRHGRFGPTAANWFTAHASRRRELDIDVVDLVETDLPEALGDQDEDVPPQVQALAPRLSAADAFVVVTPEYNHSFPAAVKTVIDWYFDEWAAKPVTFVSYGRESGGLHATAQLRQVFAELNAVAIRNTVSLPCYWDQFAADGSWPKQTSGFDDAITVTLDQLVWWASALRSARAKSPYPC